MPPNDEREKQQQMMFQPVMPPHMGQDNNRIDVNLDRYVAMAIPFGGCRRIYCFKGHLP